MTTTRERKVWSSDAQIGTAVRHSKKKAGAYDTGPEECPLETVLEVDLHSELELSRIKRRRRTAVVTTVGRALVECVDIVEEG